MVLSVPQLTSAVKYDGMLGQRRPTLAPKSVCRPEDINDVDEIGNDGPRASLAPGIRGGLRSELLADRGSSTPPQRGWTPLHRADSRGGNTKAFSAGAGSRDVDE